MSPSRSIDRKKHRGRGVARLLVGAAVSSSTSRLVAPCRAAGIRAAIPPRHRYDGEDVEVADILREEMIAPVEGGGVRGKNIDDSSAATPAFLDDPFEHLEEGGEGEEAIRHRFLWGHHLGHEPHDDNDNDNGNRVDGAFAAGDWRAPMPILTGGPQDLDHIDDDDDNGGNTRFNRNNNNGRGRGRRYRGGRGGDDSSNNNENKHINGINFDTRHPDGGIGIVGMDAAATGRTTTKTTGMSPELEKRIVDGLRVSSEWPTVGITLVEANGQYFPGDCGCTLIANRWAVTAAHCASNMIKNDLLGRLDAVMLGAYALYEKGANGKNNGGREFQVIKIKRALEHKLHKAGGAQGNDIMLLELEKDAHPYITSHIMPVADCSYYDSLERGTKLTAMGMGKIEEDGPRSTVMRTVDVNFVDRGTCDSAFRAYQVDETMMCAGGDRTGDACGGDSGSCLIRRTTGNSGDKFGTGVQVGLVSWGIGCNSGTPGVYANVCKYIDWFRSFDGMEGLKVASAPSNGGSSNGGNGGGNGGISIGFSMQPVGKSGATSYNKKQQENNKSCRDATGDIQYTDPKKAGKTKSETCKEAAKKGACDAKLVLPSAGGGKQAVTDACPSSCGMKGC